MRTGTESGSTQSILRSERELLREFHPTTRTCPHDGCWRIIVLLINCAAAFLCVINTEGGCVIRRCMMNDVRWTVPVEWCTIIITHARSCVLVLLVLVLLLVAAQARVRLCRGEASYVDLDCTARCPPRGIMHAVVVVVVAVVLAGLCLFCPRR